MPPPSVTVKVTVALPTSVQVSVDGLAVKEAIPQLSVEPLLMAAPVTVAIPLAFRVTLVFWHTATGGTTSLATMVTVEVHVLVFPFTSVTVNVTVFGPTLEQLKFNGVALKLAIPQASLLPLFTIAGVIVALPVPSKETEMFWHTAVGAVTSDTVTVAVQVAVFPAGSDTVKVTLLAPMFAQVKVDGESEKETLQLSVLPLFTELPGTVTVPAAPRFTEMFWHTAVGTMLSVTVTTAVQVLLLPFTSVTVNVTLLAPTFAQVKAVWLKPRVAMPHASVEPLFTAAAVVEALPLVSKMTVTFWQVATGATLSFTVTTAVQVAVLPAPSVTVSVTLLVPTFAQVNKLGEASSDEIPQLSVLPLLIAEPVMPALPLGFRFTLMFWQVATGGVMSAVPVPWIAKS